MTEERTVFVALKIAVVVIVLLAGIALAAAQSSTRSFYTGSGNFAGSSVTMPRGSTTQGAGTSSFSNSQGHFSGSAIHNRDGSTSFYDKNGRFSGSSTNTTQPR
jgi:hypothetical protein